MGIEKIQTKVIASNPAICSDKQQTAEKTPAKNITNLADMPVTPINIKTPISYTPTGEIDILNGLKAQTYKLANGQKVIILPKKGPTIVKTYVNVGSMNEPDNIRGISHYIEHNLFNGTPSLKAGEFFQKVNELGATTNASTSFSTTDYFISSQLLKEGDLEEKIKMHSDMLQNPTFAPDMLEKERGPVISEISMVMDEPQNIAINRAIKNLYQIETKSPDLIAGTVENIQNVTREDVVNYFNTHYTPDNYTTVITGDINPNEAIKLVSKYFTKQNPPKPAQKKYENLTPIETSIRTEEVSKKATASTVVTAFAGPKNIDTKDKIATEVLLNILSDSRNAKIKKALEPLHISVETGIEKVGNKKDDQKALLVCFNCSPDKVDNALKVIYQEIFNAQNGSISQKDVETAKKRLNLSINNTAESSSALNSFIGSSLLDYDPTLLSQYKTILNSLTAEDLQNTAKKYLNLQKASIAVVNPESKPPNNSNIVSFGSGKFIKKEAIDISKIKSFRLNNNLEITTTDNNVDSSVFTMSLSTNAPAYVKPGVAEMLSEMLNRGSAFKSKEEFFNEAEENGISIAFSASPNGLAVMSKSTAKDTQKAVYLAKEAILNPNFSPENFEHVKNRLIETLKTTPQSADTNANAELFKHFPFSATDKELLDSLQTLTLEDVKGLYAYIMQNASGNCIVSTPKDKQSEIITLLATELSFDMPTLQPYKPRRFNSYQPIEKNKIIATQNERNQADVVKCYKFKTNGNISDYAKFSLMNIILGGNPNSRLFNDLREKQKLAYRVRSNFSCTDNTGVIKLSIKTTTDNPAEGNDKLDNLKKSLKGFDKNINLMRSTLVTDKELESAKLFLKTRILDTTETSADQVSDIADSLQTLYGVNYANLLLAEIDKVTKEDIQAAANYAFNGNSLTSIVASQKTLEHFKNHQ